MSNLNYRRLAVLVGINYSGTPVSQLHGCINDARRMRDFLVRNYAFRNEDIQLLTDEPQSPTLPTGENIWMALCRMFDRAEVGDVVFFHFSGHGTRIPFNNPGPYVGGDEAIVPLDMDLLTSTDFRHLVNDLGRGAIFTFISDSCHSGGLIGQEREQIGPNTTRRSTTTNRSHRSKFMPFESLRGHLPSPQTRINTSDGRSRFIPFESLQGHLPSRRTRTNTSDSRAHTGSFRQLEDEGILLSGCQADEYSHDVGFGADAHGAFTNAVLILLEEYTFQRRTLPPHRDLVLRTRSMLQEEGLRQHPCLYCSDKNVNHGLLYPVYYAHLMRR